MLNKPSRFVLWGSSGHAKILASLIAENGGEVIALFDNKDVSPALPNVPLYLGDPGFKHWASGRKDLAELSGLVAIGGQRGRDRIIIQELFKSWGLQLPSLLHPTASVCKTVTLGAGTQILAQAIVAADVRIGAGCIVNHAASVDHECNLGNGVHIAPNATLCGCITVGDYSFIGAGSVVLPHRTIGSGAVVGAGAVVTKDVAPDTTVVGNPARCIR
jgi:sugar O-acyltransferase (sialic acid O-acetyltransferase NeuD family)